MTALLARWTEGLAGGPQAERLGPPLAMVMGVGRQQQHPEGWFKTSLGVRPWFLLSPMLLNDFLEPIVTDAVGTVSIGGRQLTNLRFAYDIDGIAGSKQRFDN